MSSSSDFVLPGDVLAVIEEYIPGEGVYVDDGLIRAAVVGFKWVDARLRRINVKPATGKPRVPRRGSAVYGYVSYIPRDDIALLRIVYDERMRQYSGGFTGILHISQSSEERLSSIYDAVRLGDFVKVQVLNARNPYVVSTKGAQFGVVLAFCSRCGEVLVRRMGEPHLVCPRCGNRERRKISAQYMVVERDRRGRGR